LLQIGEEKVLPQPDAHLQLHAEIQNGVDLQLDQLAGRRYWESPGGASLPAPAAASKIVTG
jgi:hypothetical protein